MEENERTNIEGAGPAGSENQPAETCEIMFEPTDDETVIRALRDTKTIAVVGMSANPEKAGHRVGKYLHEAGYNVIPVHPAADEVAGLKAFRGLKDIPVKVDVVDVFRPHGEVPRIMDLAIEIGARAVWLQEGIVHHEAAEKARAAGIDVIMDRCMMKEHRALAGRG